MAEGYKDFTAGMTLTAADLEEYCELQGIPRFASAAARDTALAAVLIEGLTAYLKDTNAVCMYTGSVWTTVMTAHGALGGWTPTVTQTGSVTVTVTYAKLQRIGRLIEGWFSLAVTGSGSGGTAVIVSAPLTAAQADIPVGNGMIYDTSGNAYYNVNLHLESTSSFSLRTASGTGDTRLGVLGFVAGLASGDLIKGHFTYEAGAD